MKKAFFQLHLAIFLYGFTAVLGKMITLQLAPMLLWRLFFTMIVLWSIALIFKKYRLIDYKILLSIFLVGFMMATHWFFFYGSVRISTVSNALAAFSTIGFFTALLEPLVEKKKIDRFELILGLLSFFGIVIIFKFDTHFRMGILFGLLAALTASIFSIMNKRLLTKIESSKLTLYELSFTFISIILLLPLFEYFFPSTTYMPDKRDLLLIIFFAIVCTILTFQLMFNAQKHVSAFTVSISFNMEPLYGIILAFIFLNEGKYWTISFLVGFLFVFMSSMLQMLRLWKPQLFKPNRIFT